MSSNNLLCKGHVCFRNEFSSEFLIVLLWDVRQQSLPIGQCKNRSKKRLGYGSLNWRRLATFRAQDYSTTVERGSQRCMYSTEQTIIESYYVGIMRWSRWSSNFCSKLQGHKSRLSNFSYPKRIVWTPPLDSESLYMYWWEHKRYPWP